MEIIRRWPTALGAAVALLAGIDAVADASLAPLVVLCAVVYVGAAAFGRKLTWPVFGAVLVVFVLGQALDRTSLTTWVLVGIGAAVTVAAALLRRTDRTVTAVEVAGFAAFAATAVAAVALGGRTGTVLVALAIGLHGVWDIVHHRRDIVVARSYAEFCAVLDLVLAGLLGWAAAAA